MNIKVILLYIYYHCMASHTHMYQELRRGQNQKRKQCQLRDMGEGGESRSDILFHHHPGLSTKQST